MNEYKLCYLPVDYISYNCSFSLSGINLFYILLNLENCLKYTYISYSIEDEQSSSER